jgi:aminoacrylate peracid reductase
MNQAINPEGWIIGKTATGLNHLNWGIKAGNHVYVAGMLSTDPIDGSLVGVGDIEVQTRRVLVSYFPAILPARFCVKLEMVRPEFLVEIATTAVIPA